MVKEEGDIAEESNGRARSDARWMVGELRLRRVGILGYPVWQLMRGDEAIARLGRISWWSVYFGFGQKIELADGTRWRLRSHESRSVISAILLDSDLRRVAMATVGSSGYGINARNFAYLLFPHDDRRLGANEWTLSSHDEDCAVVQAHPPRLTAERPVPLATVILALNLVRIGIPGEKKIMVPSVQWTKG